MRQVFDILANIFPGLRDLRTPLSCGLVLAATILIIVSPQAFLNPPPGTPLAAYKDLATAAGSGAVLSGVAFGSYLLGVAWTVVFELILRFGNWLGEKWDWLNRLFVDNSLSIEFSEIVRMRLQDEIKDKDSPTATSFEKAMERFNGYREPEMFLYRDALNALRPIASANLLADVPSQLLGKEEALWSAWDRLDSEREFRLNLCIPLALLSAAASLSLSYWFVLGFFVSAGVFAAGFFKQVEATKLLFGAIKSGRATLLRGNAFPNVEWRVGKAPGFILGVILKYRSFEQGVDAEELTAEIRRARTRIPFVGRLFAKTRGSKPDGGSADGGSADGGSADGGSADGGR